MRAITHLARVLSLAQLGVVGVFLIEDGPIVDVVGDESPLLDDGESLRSAED